MLRRAPSAVSPEQARANVIREILNAEREYVKHLKDVVQVGGSSGRQSQCERVRWLCLGAWWLIHSTDLRVLIQISNPKEQNINYTSKTLVSPQKSIHYFTYSVKAPQVRLSSLRASEQGTHFTLGQTKLIYSFQSPRISKQGRSVGNDFLSFLIFLSRIIYGSVDKICFLS